MEKIMIDEYFFLDKFFKFGLGELLIIKVIDVIRVVIGLNM